MRSVLCLLILLFSNISLASGKISFKPSVNHDGSAKGYALGLSVFEKILPGLYADTWHGYGEKEDDKDKWFKSEVGVLAFVGHVGIGCGNVSVYDVGQQTWDHKVYGKLQLELW